MHLRNLTAATMLVVLGAFSSCSDSSSQSPSTVTGDCGDPDVFCLVTCNLGCTQDGGCNITEIAQNQPLIFQFSQEVDPRSVNLTTLSLKTSTGEEPVGTLFTEGATVTFIPEVRSVQGATFFGFTSNQEYVLNIGGGDATPDAVLSTSGDRLVANYACSLRVSRGIIDLDQSPPQATVLSPAQETNVPTDTAIVVEFSELIDQTPFFNAAEGAEPVQFRIRKTLDTGNGRICNPEATFRLPGTSRLENDLVRGVTILTFQPAQELPGSTCLEIQVSSSVRDLAGTRSSATTFRFELEESNKPPRVLEETFENDLNIDRERSGGEWSGGKAVFAQLGGDGRHGRFNLSDGNKVGATAFEWNTDRMELSENVEGFLNDDVVVTDGRYYFTDFELLAGETLVFVGSKPARIFVRGNCVVEGTILANGEDVTGGFVAKNTASTGTTIPGQPGGRGGPGGGDGGAGANACDGSGDPNKPQFNNFNGYDGGDLEVPAGHAYANRVTGTGGKGATLFPAHGDSSQVIFRSLSGTYAVEAASGGGGGGHAVAGDQGEAVNAGSVAGEPANTNAGELGPSAAGGRLFPSLNAPANVASSEFYVAGGGGGGGGGSQPVFANRSNFADPNKYRAGGGGAGGGGALVMRVGNDAIFGANSLVDVSGGTGDPTASSITINSNGAPSPGGSGAGGSLLLQIAGNIDQQGTLDARGGAAIPLDVTGFFRCKIFGGKGGDGILRVEMPQVPTAAQVGNVQPPVTEPTVMLAKLEEGDEFAGFQSKFLGTGAVFPPDFLRYEVRAIVDGVERTYSDDPSVGDGPAFAGSAPVILWAQGIDLDASTGEPPPGEQPRPWRRYVGSFALNTTGELGVASDAKTGVRWALLIDRTMTTDVEVLDVKIYYRL